MICTCRLLLHVLVLTMYAAQLGDTYYGMHLHSVKLQSCTAIESVQSCTYIRLQLCCPLLYPLYKLTEMMIKSEASYLRRQTMSELQLLLFHLRHLKPDITRSAKSLHCIPLTLVSMWWWWWVEAWYFWRGLAGEGRENCQPWVCSREHRQLPTAACSIDEVSQDASTARIVKHSTPSHLVYPIAWASPTAKGRNP